MFRIASCCDCSIIAFKALSNNLVKNFYRKGVFMCILYPHDAKHIFETLYLKASVQVNNRPKIALCLLDSSARKIYIH